MMRCSSWWPPLYYFALVVLLVLWCAAWWLGSAGRRALAVPRVRLLTAIAANLSRILAATETESDVLNKDISKVLGMIHKHMNRTGMPHR